MRIVYSKYGLEIITSENLITVVDIENPTAFSDFASNVWKQINGEVGDIVCSNNGKEINISKIGTMVFNPFSISCNEKKILTKLYQEILDSANEDLQEDTLLIKSSILSYLDKLLGTVPYNTTYGFDVEIGSFLKLYDVKLDECYENLVEKIIEYIKALHRICKTVFFIFVNLKNYLNIEEQKQLYEFANYEKVELLLIESTKSMSVECEKYWILDEDLCIIEL